MLEKQLLLKIGLPEIKYRYELDKNVQFILKIML